MIDPDDLLYQQVLKKLQQDDLTASEIEVCRKYLNDRSGRGGAVHTNGHATPKESTRSDWAELKFEDVKITRKNG